MQVVLSHQTEGDIILNPITSGKLDVKIEDLYVFDATYHYKNGAKIVRQITVTKKELIEIFKIIKES